MRLTFHGASGTVTGSNFLLESGGHKILIDCGLYQGSHFADKQNFEPFAYDPSKIEAVVVSHAHLDHTGRLPKLLCDGFKGTVYSTPPTRDFGELILLDSEHILEKEAVRERVQNFCSAETVRRLMQRWKGVEYHEPFTIGPFKIELYDAGHILGSSITVVEAEGKRVVFSGDLGNYPAPIIKHTEFVEGAQYCIVDSTYGDRVHDEPVLREKQLKDAIVETIRAGGVLMIPAFAMERTQQLLFHINELVEHGHLPRVPVFIDSPLAIKLTAVYKKYEDYFNQATSSHLHAGDDIFNFPGLRFTLTTQQSKEINNVPPPKVIIAGSGMSHGGRILHHEMRYLSDPKSTILFVGFQAKGSLGRRIMEGAETVHIFGEEILVRCKRHVISSYSAHADQPRILEWLSKNQKTLKKVFLVHGENGSREVLGAKIKEKLNVAVAAPKEGDTFEI